MKDCIIVTGSSGLIGSAFIDRIGERFIEFGFDREGPPHPPPKTEHVIDCDLGSDESVAYALNEAHRLGGTQIASVIHLAAYYDFSGEPSSKYEEITVRGTERLLRGLRDFAVGQFVFSSTMLVLAVGAWCTLCLVTAVAMLIMISPAADEVVATIQFLRHSRRAGQSFWRTFWKGGTIDGSTESAAQFSSPARSANWATVLGLSHPTWTLMFSAALGIWLMFAPSVFGTHGLAAHNDHLIGPLVATFAVIALGEIGRAVRWLNVLLGTWLIIAPWILSGGVTVSRWNDVVVGAALLMLSIPRGQIREQYGAFNRAIV